MEAKKKTMFGIVQMQVICLSKNCISYVKCSSCYLGEKRQV